MANDTDQLVEVTVHLQAWYRERAVEVDDSPVRFTVPRAEATTDDGDILPDDTYASDALKQHRNAPDRVRTWNGPFYITLEEVAK